MGEDLVLFEHGVSSEMVRVEKLHRETARLEARNEVGFRLQAYVIGLEEASEAIGRGLKRRVFVRMLACR